MKELSLCIMKTSIKVSLAALLSLLLLTGGANAQNKIGIDIAGIRNMHSHINGLNVSAFYHFSEKLVAGVEMNRFFPNDRKKAEEDITLSAWDFDFNVHYLIPIHHNWKFYPVSGISHTSEKEYLPNLLETRYERFWSFNTGAGMLWEVGHWSPHIEYVYTWGLINQQFLLAGLSYEIEWGSKKHSSKE